MFRSCFGLVFALTATAASAADTSHCLYQAKHDWALPDKIQEAFYYLIHSNQNRAAACAKATVLHTLNGKGIASWAWSLGVVAQKAYEPNYPQSSEFPNHPRGFIRTGGEGPLHRYVYPKLPDGIPMTGLNGSPSTCGEEMIVGKGVMFLLPTLNMDKGVQNAARHAGLACVLGSFCGFASARAMMDTHEQMSPDDGPEDSRCDVWNNDYGLRAGRQLHQILLNKNHMQVCSPALDGISDKEVVRAFDLIGAPAFEAGEGGIVPADNQTQIEWVERNCQRAIEAMLRSGQFCIDRPKPLEPAANRQPRGNLPSPIFGSCTAVAPATSEETSTQAPAAR